MDPNRKLSLLRKLTTRVADALHEIDVEVTPEMLRDARDCIERAWFEHGSVSEKHLALIVDDVCLRYAGKARPRRHKKQSYQTMMGRVGAATPQPSSKAGASKHAAAIAAAAELNQQQQQQQQQEQQRAASTIPQTTSSSSNQPLQEGEEATPERIAATTKQQRRVMADRQWNSVHDEDRRLAEQMKNEQKDKLQAQRNRLKEGLEKQLQDHEIRRVQQREARLREQKEMDSVVANVAASREEERRLEKERATKQKEFQLAQQAENSRLRAARRELDRDEQLRQCALVEAQERESRDKELTKKEQQKGVWKRVLEDNVHRFHDRKRERAEKMANDREVIRLMNEKFDAEERNRAETKARKEARRDFFGKLASAVADKMQSKEQKQIDKIEREAEQEEARAAQEKQDRLAAQKKRAADTRLQLEEQKKQKELRRQEELREAELLAEAVRQQAEAEREHKRKLKEQKKEDAMKQRKFLDSQLQMQFMREANAMETSIMRPRNATWNENTSAIRSRLASRNSNRSNTPAQL